MCARDDKCGPFDHRTVSVTGSEAGRLEFGDGGGIGGVFTGLKAVKRKRDDDQGAVDGLMEKPAAANVTAGCVLVTVTSRTGVPIRCLQNQTAEKRLQALVPRRLRLCSSWTCRASVGTFPSYCAFM